MIVTAGGKGSRIKEVEGEKPLIPSSVPMIAGCWRRLWPRGVGAVHVSITSNTPEQRSISAIEDRRHHHRRQGYSEDLNQVMSGLTSDHVMVLLRTCP